MPRSPHLLTARVGWLVALGAWLAPSVVRADFVSAPEQVLPGIATFGGFGTSVAVDAVGTRIAVGTVNMSSSDRGGVVFFVRSGTTWTEEGRLVRYETTQLGFAVAMDAAGTVALVGEPGASGGVGAIRVLRRTGSSWIEASPIVPPSMVVYFGRAIALSGDGRTAVIGAGFAGEAFVYQESGGVWSLVTTLTPPGLPDGSQFGAAVAISGDGEVAMVGAPAEPFGGMTNIGSVRVFRRSTGWGLEQTLRGPTGTSTGTFYGRAIAIDAAGTNAITCGLLYTTHAYTYAGGTWAARGTLGGSQGGIAISGDGSRVLIGGAGGASVHRWDGSAWVGIGVIVGAGFPGPSTSFGAAVALTADATRVVIGDPGNAAVGDEVSIYASVGGVCAADSDCTSGHCSDGVCCASGCGGSNATDCMACINAATGRPDGFCAPLTAALAPTVTCRPAAGMCDRAETCSSASTACPTDRFSTSLCRASADLCDAPEYCFNAPDCPADRAFPAGARCRVAYGPCDVPESCDGVAFSCPADDHAVAGTTCRASTDACDPAEVCDGAAIACPSDVSACEPDAGMPDAGEPDAGEPDAGEPDAGMPDAGEPDAGMPDAGTPDAGEPDAGTDAAVGDSGPIARDAGADAGADAGGAVVSDGCSCRGGKRSPLSWWMLAMAAVLAVRRRRR